MTIARVEILPGGPARHRTGTEPDAEGHEHTLYAHDDPRWLVCDCGQYAVRSRTMAGEASVRLIDPPRPTLALATTAMPTLPSARTASRASGSLPAPRGDGAEAHRDPGRNTTRALALVPTLMQERCRTVAGCSADFAIEVDPAMTITWVSDPLPDVLGWHPDEIVGAPATAWFPDDEPGQSWHLLARALHGDVVSGSRRVRTASGSEVWVDRASSPVRDWAGDIIAIVTGFHLLGDVGRPSQGYG